jgi:hypothetical protein
MSVPGAGTFVSIMLPIMMLDTSGCSQGIAANALTAAGDEAIKSIAVVGVRAPICVVAFAQGETLFCPIAGEIVMILPGGERTDLFFSFGIGVRDFYNGSIAVRRLVRRGYGGTDHWLAIGWGMGSWGEDDPDSADVQHQDAEGVLLGYRVIRRLGRRTETELELGIDIVIPVTDEDAFMLVPSVAIVF